MFKKKKRIRFALEMKDGIQVRTLEDLQENFDLEKAVGYFLEGKLLTWLKDRRYDNIAEKLEKLSPKDTALNKKLCQILEVQYQDEEFDPEEIEWRNERIARLKQYTDNPQIIENVDIVAFDQEDLADLLDEEINIIYLCQNKFTIPLGETNKKYIGIGKVEVVIKSKNVIDFDRLNIKFINIQFNSEYEQLLRKSSIKEKPFVKDNTESTKQEEVVQENLTPAEKFFQQGQKAEQEHEFEKALNLYKKSLELGKKEANFYLDRVYTNLSSFHKGKKAEANRNWDKAMDYYRKSVIAGGIDAMYRMSVIYSNDAYHQYNLDKSIDWLFRAAIAGNKEAEDIVLKLDLE